MHIESRYRLCILCIDIISTLYYSYSATGDAVSFSYNILTSKRSDIILI